MFILSGHIGDISHNALLFTPDGQELVSAGGDLTVRVWDVSEQCQKAMMRGHAHIISGLTQIPRTCLFASGGWEGSVWVWDLTTNQPLRSLTQKASVFSLTASPDGNMLAVAGGKWSGYGDDEGNAAWIWDTRTWKPKPNIGVHYARIYTLCFSPDGKQLITGAADRLCCIWDVESGDRLASLTHSTGIQGLAVMEGKLAVAAGRRVVVWTLPAATKKSPTRLATLTGYTGRVLTAAFSPDGRLLATGGEDGHVRIWDMEAERWHRDYHWKVGRIHAVTFAPDGLTMAAGGDGDIVVWDVE